jgi:hypothetical protein
MDDIFVNQIEFTDKFNDFGGFPIIKLYIRQNV